MNDAGTSSATSDDRQAEPGTEPVTAGDPPPRPSPDPHRPEPPSAPGVSGARLTDPTVAPTAPPAVPADPAALARRIRTLQASAGAGRRVIIGIAGAPGAGKSTFATDLVAACGPDAVLVGMDGYHLAQRVLDAAGLAEIKGAPETFDAAGYVALLDRLGAVGTDTVYAPEFRREIEEPVAGAVAIPPSAQVVITEGNYLLLDTPPWDRARSLLTEVWFLDVPEDLRLHRLVQRHIRFGRSPEAARERAVRGSDGANARTVMGTRHCADLLLRPLDDETGGAGAPS
jgi:pantothenate kinase